VARVGSRAEPAPPLANAVQAIASLTGWRNALVALAAGATSVLALAPFFFWPVLFITFPLLVWLIDGCCAGEPKVRARMLKAARIGWFFGFGYFLAGLYWIGNSFLVEADRFAWLLPLAVTALPAGLAAFFALGTALAGFLWRPGLARLAALTLGLGLGEWARGHVLTGLPWNTIGYALTANEAMMQWASLFGVYGLSYIAVAIFCAPAAILGPQKALHEDGFQGLFYVLISLSVLSGGWAWGKIRLENARIEMMPGITLRIVQPNIPQAEKWVPGNQAPIFKRYLELSMQGQEGGKRGLDGITHLIWPESALPFLLTDSTEALTAIAALLPEGTTLLTGQARAEDELRADGSRKRQHIYNSLMILNDRAQVLTQYDKIHLVPFGEYLPFQATLEAIGLEQLTRVRGGFSPGKRKRFITPEGTPPLAPLICYEIIFPDAIRMLAKSPVWMLNVTNDAWFGASIGPYQHFHQARIRTVEQGLPLVRAANTGISGVIDPYGRIVATLPLGRAGTLDVQLPEPARAPFFVRAGILIELFLAIFTGILWFFFSQQKRRHTLLIAR